MPLILGLFRNRHFWFELHNLGIFKINITIWKIEFTTNLLFGHGIALGVLYVLKASIMRV